MLMICLQIDVLFHPSTCSFLCPLTAVYEERLYVQLVTLIAKFDINCNMIEVMIEVQRNKQKHFICTKNVKFTLIFCKSWHFKVDI